MNLDNFWKFKEKEVKISLNIFVFERIKNLHQIWYILFLQDLKILISCLYRTEFKGDDSSSKIKDLLF